MEEAIKIYSKEYRDILLRVIPGHFVTSNSHINHYIDLTLMKSRESEAMAIAKALANEYVSSTVVDTVLCMDGCEVIGAYLAQRLTQSGISSMNAHNTIYITTPEHDITGQLIFRDNVQTMVRDKHVLLLLATTTTGRTVQQALESIDYYGGKIVGVSAIFSAVSKIYNIPINAIFTTSDIPNYRTYEQNSCKMCQEGMKVDAIANGYGYSRLG